MHAILRAQLNPRGNQMSDNTFSKSFIITSQVMPEDLFCFEEVDLNSWKIRAGFSHQVHEVQNLDNIPDGIIDDKVVYVALCKGDGNGLFSYESHGLVASVHTDEYSLLYVRPNGDFISVPTEKASCRHAFHPSKFGLEPYPVWKESLQSDLTDTVSLR